MIKQVVSFGCSWTYGDEILDPNLDPGVPAYDRRNDSYRNAKSFPGLIASHYGVPYRCLAYPGASLRSMVWNLNWWLDNTPDSEKAETLVLVGLTEESRMSWYNPYHQAQTDETSYEEQLTDTRTFVHKQYIHSTWLKEDIDIKDEPYQDEWRELYKMYLTLSSCRESGRLNYEDAVRAFDGASARYNIPMLQFNVLATTRKPKLPTLLDATSLMEILVIRDKPRKNPLFMPEKHPNEAGHRVIADYLIEKLDSAIMS